VRKVNADDERQAAELIELDGEAGGGGGLGAVSDLLLRKSSVSRAGAEAPDDYDVIGADGLIIGRIFRASTAPAGTPWMWTLAYGQRQDRAPTHGYAWVNAAATISPLRFSISVWPMKLSLASLPRPLR
jgi:hypothetical protein